MPQASTRLGVGTNPSHSERQSHNPAGTVSTNDNRAAKSKVDIPEFVTVYVVTTKHPPRLS